MATQEKNSSHNDPETLREQNAELHETIQTLKGELARVRESLRRYKYMIENQGEGIGIVDLQERFIFCNPSAERLFGVGPGALIHRNLSEFMPPQEFSKVRAQTGLRRRGVRSTYEAEIVRPDGERRYLSIVAVPWIERDGEVQGAFASFRDVTDQRRAEQALVRERDRARTYLELAGVMLLALDAAGRVLLINRRGCEILRCTEEEALGRNWFEAFVPERVRRDASAVFFSLLEGRTDAEYSENPVLAADGEERLIAWRNTPLRDDGGRIVGTLSSGEDITEKRKTEAELLRLERLRAMAEMTAGVSHNLNNILMGVIAHAQLLQTLARDHRVLNEAGAILRCTHRAVDLVEKLRSAVVGGEEELVALDVNAHVREVIEELGPRLRHLVSAERRCITVATRLQEVPPVHATSAGMHDVLVNLLLNSIDAMPRGGRIHVTTAAASGVVIVEVRDEGVGMDDETKRRAFEPFFTTKAEVGTGLGLSTVYSAVTRWGGEVDLASSLGKGTTVTLKLPQAQPHQAPLRPLRKRSAA